MALSRSDEEVRGRLRHLDLVPLSKTVEVKLENTETVSFHANRMLEYKHRTTLNNIT
jgi:hypothetical protein